MSSLALEFNKLGLENKKATYFDGQTVQKKIVQITSLHPEFIFEIQNHDGSLPKIFSFESHQIKSERIHEKLTYVHLNFMNGERLEVTDPKLIELLKHISQSKNIHAFTHVPAKITFAVIVIIAICFSIWLGTPKLAKYTAHKISFKSEYKLRVYVEKFTEKEVCKSPNSKVINRILTRLAQSLLSDNHIEMPVDVYLGSTKTVNAIALPSEIIIVYPGLIEKIQKYNPKQAKEILAGILAHELQHHIQRHIVESVVRSALLTFAWSTALGDFSSMAVVDPSTLIQIVNLKFSREIESEADLKAAQMLSQTKIAVMPFLNFLDQLTREMHMDKMIKLEFLSNHPLKDRGERLKPQFANTQTQSVIMSDADWLLLAQGCNAKENK